MRLTQLLSSIACLSLMLESLSSTSQLEDSCRRKRKHIILLADGVQEGVSDQQILRVFDRKNDGFFVHDRDAVSYTHLTLPTTPYV